MGNTRSSPDDEEKDSWWEPTQAKSEHKETPKQANTECRVELSEIHERRRKIIAEKRAEMEALREEIRRLTEENQLLKQDKPDYSSYLCQNRELKTTIAALQTEIQGLNAQVVSFEEEKTEYKTHVTALKDVISVSKQMLMIRESQLKELREKVTEIEATLAGREMKVLSQDLREEYERQLQNIRSLRTIYEERQRADKREKEEMKHVIDSTKQVLEEERSKNKDMEENVQRLEAENSGRYDEIKNLESTLGLTRAESRQYQAELSVINQLFSEILLGFNNNQEIDIDDLVKLLEENHDILQNIAINEASSQVSALPKVLLNLVRNLDEKNPQKEEKEASLPNQLNSAVEIAENLPKVWKILIELLSHQRAPVVAANVENACYNVVQTPKGPDLVLSVSKTFIRLKDLILEKKFLERETARLKQLNTHLEVRLQEQEKRLDLVSNEVSETWNVVGKLQKKHELLHTQEKILRYELAQKRKLLVELRKELEYSREKWQEARDKNTNTEKEWQELRNEFAARKQQDDGNNSIESGYSDDADGDESDTEPPQKGDEREQRLSRLETLANSLVVQITNTNSRGEEISERLDAIHGRYNEEGSPPE